MIFVYRCVLILGWFVSLDGTKGVILGIRRYIAVLSYPSLAQHSVPTLGRFFFLVRKRG